MSEKTLKDTWIAFTRSIYMILCVPDAGGFLFGLIAAALILSTGRFQIQRLAAYYFLIVLILIGIFSMSRWGIKRPPEEIKPWGLFSLFVFGCGIGLLAYQFRDWWGIWIWFDRKISTPEEFLLHGLFLFGVILGVFVVRIWSKEEGDFVKSVTATLGGAIIPPLLGNSVHLDPVRAFAYYFIGFTLSASLNVSICAWLIASYTNRHSLRSRAVLDFMYGKDKAKAVDGYFLENFKEDPDYAKAALIEALRKYREIIRAEFAAKMENRRNQWLSSEKHPNDPCQNMYYYQLISVVGKHGVPSEIKIDEKADLNKEFDIIYRPVKEITADMFRVAISAKWQDTLEYVVPPGEYKRPFPYIGSVAGLALSARKTIIMQRDGDKKFRTAAYREGRTPNEAFQPRGLQIIDYLSYIVVPMVSNFGKAQESELGILHVDSTLFASKEPIAFPRQENARTANEEASSNSNFLTGRLSMAQLYKYAENLFKPDDDACLMYLERAKSVIIPILSLYLKCRQGASLGTAQ